MWHCLNGWLENRKETDFAGWNAGDPHYTVAKNLVNFFSLSTWEKHHFPKELMALGKEIAKVEC